MSPSAGTGLLPFACFCALLSLPLTRPPTCGRLPAGPLPARGQYFNGRTYMEEPYGFATAVYQSACALSYRTAQCRVEGR